METKISQTEIPALCVYSFWRETMMKQLMIPLVPHWPRKLKTFLDIQTLSGKDCSVQDPILY